MDTPLVSVLLVVHDGERYLEEAVESLLAQHFRDFEIVAVDDGSQDGSAAILRRLAQDDPRIRVFAEPWRGLTPQLCKAVGEARGRYLARMDADDVCRPDRLWWQVDYLERHPECVALGSEAWLVDPDRRAIRILGVATQHDEIEAQLLQGRGDAILHPSVMLRREAVEAVGGYRSEFRVSQCLDLFLRLAEHGRLANLSEPLLDYRQHTGKVSSQRKGEQRRTQDAILREAYARRGLSPSSLPERPPVPEQVPDSDSWHRWSSWAIDAGHLRTGRRYAWKLARSEPFDARTWRLALRAALGLRLSKARRIQAELSGWIQRQPEMRPAARSSASIQR